ncbi:MAG: flippase activity-associated protein Agl23 [Anaerolineae bacterium]
MRETTVDEREPFWERPLAAVLSLSVEQWLYVLLGVLTLATRLWGLGDRAMSHDESLHVVYSWKLYAGEGYQHDPMMHGPFLFHINALIYLLFGDNDFTGRLAPALLGTLLVLLPYFMRRWLGRLGAFAASLMLFLSPTIFFHSRYIRHDIFAATFATLVILFLFRYLEEGKDRWLWAAGAAIGFVFCTKEVSFIYMAILGLFVAGCFALEWWREGRRLPPQGSRLLDATVVLGTLSLPLLSPFLTKVLGFNPLDYSDRGILRSGVVFLGFALVAIGIGLWWDRRRWPVIAGTAYLIMTLLFTTFFTNGRGFATGFVGSLGYWLEQHGVQRGDQPWYYYLILIPMYEFLPLVFSLGGVGYVVARGRRGLEGGEAQPPVALGLSTRGLFTLFLAWWVALTWAIYSYAGEKMPWLTVHFSLPMSLLAGRWVDAVLGRVDWRDLWRRGMPYVLLGVPLLGMALYVLLVTQPFRGKSLEQLSDSMEWLLALLVAVFLIYLLVKAVRRLGGGNTLRVLFLTVWIVLALFTLRAAWMLNYVNYDYATESLVYAHATPDIKLTMREIEALSMRLYGDRSIRISYDDDSTWPFEWYLRLYPNKVYWGAQPNKEALDAPVILVGSKNWDKVKPFLGNRYYQFKRRLIWWPKEGYKGLTVSEALSYLTDPAKRKVLWDILLYRKHTTPTEAWPLVHEFRLYVRKDVVQQLWDYGAAPLAAPEVTEDPYVKAHRDVNATLVFGSLGQGPGQFRDPRNLAVDAEGNLYVLDTGNHRVQVFSPQGQFLREWGGEGVSPGHFKEPWGIAVAPDGTVYVADTWNHRIQKFTAEGEFLAQWGQFGSTDGQLGDPMVLWGPRAIAFDPEGNLLVTDTGNKRIIKYSPDGEFLGQWGGYGVEAGRYDEPVGLAVDAEGNVYVADTWNRRIQKLNPFFAPITEWAILGWESQSVVNKPYLALHGDRLYATDPEGYRVLVFDLNGNVVAVFGLFGTDSRSFGLPVGIAVDGAGNLYVADSGNHRIMKFPPVR